MDSVPWSPDGRYHAADIDPASRLDYHTGAIYPQDAASQLPVEVLQPQPGEVVIDCCAAPGSKSTQIGLRLGDDGLLICCDASAPRRKVLAENLARQGLVNALVTPMRLDQLATKYPACADAVLVDAPCSGHEPRSHKTSGSTGSTTTSDFRGSCRLGSLVEDWCIVRARRIMLKMKTK